LALDVELEVAFVVALEVTFVVALEVTFVVALEVTFVVALEVAGRVEVELLDDATLFELVVEVGVEFTEDDDVELETVITLVVLTGAEVKQPELAPFAVHTILDVVELAL
jgi:hypothetical protein